MTQRILVDANVIVSKTQFDWLFHLRQLNPGMFQTHSTYDIFAEALKALRRDIPTLPGHVIARRVEMIQDCVDEVLQDFSGELPFSGKDPDDYHVHAAAISARSDVILTGNDESDFTADPDSEPYEVITPDDFFMLVARSHPACVLPATASQFDYWRTKLNSKPLDVAIVDADCPKFAEEVRTALRHIARTM